MPDTASAARGDLDPPSAFFEAQRERLRATFELGPTLDLACGRGRHALAAAGLGARVVAVDRNAEALAELASRPLAQSGHIETRTLDLEAEPPPDLGRAAFGAVLVFRYLHRPLMPKIAACLVPGGLLLYETFTTAQRALGWGPSRSAFLLEPDELPGSFPTLEVVSYEEGLSHDVKRAFSARLVARRPA